MYTQGLVDAVAVLEGVVNNVVNMVNGSTSIMQLLLPQESNTGTTTQPGRGLNIYTSHPLTPSYTLPYPHTLSYTFSHTHTVHGSCAVSWLSNQTGSPLECWLVDPDGHHIPTSMLTILTVDHLMC